MTGTEGLLLPLLPVPLLVHAVVSGYARRRLLAFVAIASIWVFTCIGSYRIVADPELGTREYMGSMLVVIAFCYVMYALAIATGRALDLPSTSPKEPTPEVALSVVAPLWIVAAFMFWRYTAQFGLPPLFSLTTSLDYVNFYAVRAEKTTNVVGGLQWYVLGMQTLPYFAFAYACVVWQATRAQWARWFFGVSALLTIVFATSFANKGVLLTLLVYVFVIRTVFGRPLRLKHVVAFSVGGLGSVFLFYRLYLLDRSTADVAAIFGRYLVERFFLSYAEAHAWIVAIIPREHEFFNGLAFGNPGGILPFTPAEDLSQFLGGRVFAQLSNYSAPSFSQGWANFGYAGVVLIMLLCVIQVLTLQWVFHRIRPSVVSVTAYALVAERMMGYAFEPLQLVMPEELVLLLLGLFAWDWLMNRVVWRANAPIGARLQSA